MEMEIIRAFSERNMLWGDAMSPQRSLSPVAKNKNLTHHFVYLNTNNLLSQGTKNNRRGIKNAFIIFVYLCFYAK